MLRVYDYTVSGAARCLTLLLLACVGYDIAENNVTSIPTPSILRQVLRYMDYELDKRC